MELKVKGKFVTTSKVKNSQNPSCPKDLSIEGAVVPGLLPCSRTTIERSLSCPILKKYNKILEKNLNNLALVQRILSKEIKGNWKIWNKDKKWSNRYNISRLNWI